MSKKISLILFLSIKLCIIYYETSAVNILVILPYELKSHYNAFSPYLFELAKRGHNVTCASYFQEKKKIDNFTHVDVSMCHKTREFLRTVDDIFSEARSIRMQMRAFYDYIDGDRMMASCYQFQQLWDPRHNYDLIITELFYTELYFAFIHKFKVPFITLFANTLGPWVTEVVGQPDNPSYLPYTFIPYNFNLPHMTFYDRLYNTYVYTYLHYFYKVWIRPKSQRIATELFEVNEPSVDVIIRNSSLVLSFSSFVMTGPKPLVPAVVEVGGLHIKNLLPLPQDIEKFINESHYGVVYFCMGSLLREEMIPQEKRNAFLHAFSKIPQRVLWKWDGELPGKTDNIFTSKWMPQRDILAHPKVKLFISHGGALGLNEAVLEAVPILGIPIYGDQMLNLNYLKMMGMAELLEYTTIDNATVLQKMELMLYDGSYKENAKKMSQIYKDRPMSPLDTAIYWTEYVIRHKGAYHLRSSAVDLPWYQYLLLDVIAFLLALILFSCLILYYGCKTLLSFLSIIFFKFQKTNKGKKSI